MERGQLRWFGHVKRMGDERYPKRMLDWTPQGRRPVGRPKMRWLENIERGIARRGSNFNEVNEIGLYEDRHEWRQFLKRATDRL